MKTIAATVFTLAALVAAPIAHADTSDQAALKAICKLLDDGISPDGIVHWLITEHGGTTDSGRLTVATAMHAYCPQYLPIPSNWDWTGH